MPSDHSHVLSQTLVYSWSFHILGWNCCGWKKIDVGKYYKHLKAPQTKCIKQNKVDQAAHWSHYFATWAWHFLEAPLCQWFCQQDQSQRHWPLLTFSFTCHLFSLAVEPGYKILESLLMAILGKPNSRLDLLEKISATQAWCNTIATTACRQWQSIAIEAWKRRKLAAWIRSPKGVAKKKNTTISTSNHRI